MGISHLPLVLPEIPHLSGSSNSKNQCFSLHHKFFCILVEVTYKVTISTSPRDLITQCERRNWDKWGRCSLEIFCGNEKKEEKVLGIIFANLINSLTPK